MLGYYKLCRHYKFALDSIFELYPESHGVIIVEGKLPSHPKFLDQNLSLRNFGPKSIINTVWIQY